jgi:hypothetical protein
VERGKILDKGDATARAWQIIGDEKAAIKICTLPSQRKLWGWNVWGVMKPSASRLG